MKLKGLILAGLMLTSCSRDYQSLAKVNGDSISIGDFRIRLREIQFDPKLVAPDELIELKKTILNEMIEEKILEQEGRKASITVSKEEVQSAMNVEHLDEALAKQKVNKEHWAQRMAQKILAEKVFEHVTKSVSLPTEEEMRKIFDENPNLFEQQEQAHLLQIVMQDRMKAEEAYESLTRGMKFEDAVVKYSVHADSNPSGDAGFIPKGLLPEEIEKKVFSLRVGAVSPILESGSEFYIVKVLARKEERPLLWEESRQQIESMLLQKAKEKTYRDWLQGIILAAKIKRNYELLQENILP